MASCIRSGSLIFDFATLGSGSLIKGGIKSAFKQIGKQILKDEVEHTVTKQATGLLVKESEKVAEAAGKGWISKDIYNELFKIHPELRDAMEGALKKGFVTRGQGVSGIKGLMNKGIEGYLYELKVTGKFGNYRLLGNIENWVNPKKVEEAIIIFRKIYMK